MIDQKLDFKKWQILLRIFQVDVWRALRTVHIAHCESLTYVYHRVSPTNTCKYCQYNHDVCLISLVCVFCIVFENVATTVVLGGTGQQRPLLSHVLCVCDIGRKPPVQGTATRLFCGSVMFWLPEGHVYSVCKRQPNGRYGITHEKTRRCSRLRCLRSGPGICNTKLYHRGSISFDAASSICSSKASIGWNYTTPGLDMVILSAHVMRQDKNLHNVSR